MKKDLLTFQNHPLKAEIIQRWDKGETNKAINLWLKAKHPEVPLSIGTLCKHFHRYERNQDQLEAAEKESNRKEPKKKKEIPLERILLETIAQSRRMKREKTISVKDWQYLDQQMQAAVEKLIKMHDYSGERDVSTYLSELFAKVDAQETVSELKKSNESDPTAINPTSS